MQSLGPRYSNIFADLILSTARTRLRGGEVAKAAQMVSDAGMSFVRDEFSPMLAEYVADAIEKGRHDDVQRVMEIPTAASMLTSADLVVRALEVSQAKVPAAVKHVARSRGYGFAVLSVGDLSVFLHDSVVEGGIDVVKIGSRLMVSIADHPKGPRATWAAIASKESHGRAEVETLAQHEDGASLRKLRDAWGARLRDGR